ncbi:MAG: HipA domain-containing protein [Gammaproteobacteria bacterium]|nr:HipA domain-containing protein [Gammaproteobacteria bacterium]
MRDESGALCMAKFPSREDTHDVGAWELVVHRLAAKAGINVPATRGLRLGDTGYTTFLATRFDRTDDGRRRAFVSAMTLTQRADGERGASYLELVELLQSRGVNTDADSSELFRRVVFSILIHNTDDHLRNHGFFINARGIRLSPAFDINPSLQRDNLTLAINETETTCDVSIALAAHRDYGLSLQDAEAIVRQVRDAVGTWRTEAERMKVPRAERELMAAAFQA